MTVWFTSDQHYGHRNIIEYSGRPFTSLEHMHQELVARHNAVVQPNDDVWHLGDFSMDERLIPVFLPQLSGKHILVAGNHDKCHPCHKKHGPARRKYAQYGFTNVYIDTVQFGDGIVLNHLPYVGDSGHEARYPQFRPKDEGSWLLHGHVHEAWKTRGRMINVGVDQWNYAPVKLETLKALMTAGT